MIEIVFNELSRGSLANAQNYGIGNYPGGYSFVSYYNEDGSLMTESEAKAAEKFAEQEEKKRWQEATPLGGNPDDVFDLSLNLNIGDISCWDNLDKRMDCLKEFQYDQDDYDFVGFERRNHEYVLADLANIINRLKTGESARIWFGETSAETLGFEWLMWNFKNADVPADKLLINYSKTWAGTKPGDWYKYVEQATSIEQDMVELAASKWEGHMKENGILRVIEDGIIVSAPITYYDDLILQEAELLSKDKGSFQENWLMGIVCEKEPELPHYWIYTRIEKLIEKGQFQITKEAGDGWPKSWKELKVVK